ncbi:zinc finger protein 84-like [Dunckerocampus dactyliophorus]|uniref:zinc finger protein 84-like n=1 Tax=Dunckerocampus dactyliophorus TaxID=161453 RepID=UPI00240537D7|nr:zinc finger protein 84-like [Dunckerocampus dactyliophorus]
MLKELVRERLMAAADEILALFERTIASYEEELSQTREEKERLRHHLVLDAKDVQQMIGCQEEHLPQLEVGSSTLKQEDPQPPHVKEEEEELWISQEGACLLGLEEADLTTLPLTGVSVKTEEHEDKPPESPQLHYSLSEENRGAEPPSSSSSSSSPQHMTTEAGGDHHGGSQADKLLAPLSDSEHTTSHAPEDEEALSGGTDGEGDRRTHTDNKYSKCSKKKTGKKCLTCSVCAKSFTQKCALTQHMRTHSGEKPFICSACGQRFSQKGAMIIHMRRHTGEKPFCCSVCGESFAQKGHVVTHMRTHTGEKPYRCLVCDKRFAQNATFRSHMRTHTGEKPFGCFVCDKRFARKLTMVSHMRTHTGEKPFSCFVCDKKFSQKSKMVAHVRTHGEEKACQEGLGCGADDNKKDDEMSSGPSCIQ